MLLITAAVDVDVKVPPLSGANCATSEAMLLLVMVAGSCRSQLE